ncbi:MAG: polysaccharide deacetylase family protein [Xanthomonadales bacterium]|nr:polysaccharide deacetylase family protein [Xanthomonadales bacterium]
MRRLAGRLGNRALDILFLPGSQRFWKQRLLGKVMALLYHRVAPAGEHGFLSEGGAPTITPEEFQRDIRFLEDIGARFLSFSDLRRGDFPSSREFAVTITFDDGFRDSYERGLHYLDSRRIPATVFQSSAMLGDGRLVAEHALYWHASQSGSCSDLIGFARARGWVGAEGENPRTMVGRWLQEVPAAQLDELLLTLEPRMEDQAALARALYPAPELLRRAKKAGHEIGSHGHGHYHRETLGALEFEADVRTSIARLGDVLGQAPTSFSYPFNARVEGDQETCSKYFQQIATVDAQLIDRDCNPLALPRFTWPGQARNGLRHRRWLLTGRI